MTTIACDGRSIAGDGLVTGNDLTHCRSFVKVRKALSGAVVGFSGTAYMVEEAMRFLDGASSTLDAGENFEAIILHPDGLCECMDGKGRRYEQPAPCATGTGAAIALGAMAAGKTAHEAVVIARELDIYTGGEIVVLNPAVKHIKAA